jgi:FkbM family methyltransferase
MSVPATGKALARRLLRLCGVEVTRVRQANTEDIVLTNLLALVRPVAVLDVGANEGQFGDKLLSTGYGGLIVSFEALPAAHARLTARARSNPRWTVAACAALGSRSGTVQLNVAGNSQSSSVLLMKRLHAEAAPESAYVGAESVRLERLDVLAPPLLPVEGAVFLKIDTQGYEREVLEGSTGLLDRVMAIQAELSLVPLYDSSPGFIEMISYLSGRGFELFNLVPNFKDPKTGRVLQMDGFFIRAG